MLAHRFAAVVLCFVLAGGAAQAQTERLQPPSEFLGYDLGTQFTPHHRAVAYARHVAAASPRALLRPYGQSYERRPLLTLILSAPENLTRLEDIRQRHLRQTGLSGEGPSPAGDAGKAIVWLSYNVHGDEAVGTEAALKTLYALADPQNARTGRLLQDAVVLLDPCLNPDGRARYVQDYRQKRGPRPDAHPEAREHDQNWPGGRTNHYLFDLNRDWAWATQQETRARLRRYHRWMPHVHVDFHEQGVEDPYYFAPGAEPRHERLTAFQQSFQQTVGRRNARAFDQRGWLYFTDEVFDLFYPGYGDTWPLFNGAIGMTYEQGGGGRAGLMIQTAAGDTLSLKDRIAHHHVAALATLETAARERARLAQAFADYYRSARSDPPGPHAAYLVKGEDEDRVDALARLLDRERIRYGFAEGDAETRGRSYQTGERERVRIAPGDLLVPAAQPKARLASVLFEPQPALSDSLTYDITAWALPYAFGLRAYTLDELPGVRTRSDSPFAAPERARADDAYAYLAAWESLADARLLASLWQRGVRVRTARERFQAGGRRYAPGTLVIARADNRRLGNRLGEIVTGVADSLGQPVQSVESGLTAEGPDFGSGNISLLEKPRVAVLAGAPLSPASVGEVWHFFDRRLRYPATLLPADDFSAEALGDLDVLVLPSGAYDDVFSEDEQSALHRWVEGGGRLVALGGAVGFLAGAEGFGIERKPAGADSSEAAAPSASPQRYEQRVRAAASRRVPGAIFRARLDPTHPLAYGYAQGGPSSDAYFTLKRGTDAFAPLDGGWNVAMLDGNGSGRAVPASGFAGAEAQRKLAGTLVFGVEDVGAGRVVYLVDDPLFRGFWQGGMLLFSNAVFLVGQ